MGPLAPTSARQLFCSGNPFSCQFIVGYTPLQAIRCYRGHACSALFWNRTGYTIIQTLIYTHGCADCSHHLTAYVNSAVREKMITRITHCMLGVRFVHRPIHAHEGPRGLTRAHESARVPTRAHEGSRGRTSAHEGSRGPTRAHEGSRGLTRAHEGPRELTRAHEGSCKYCVGYAQYWSTDCTSDTSSSALTIRKSSTTLPMPTCHIKADGHSV